MILRALALLAVTVILAGCPAADKKSNKTKGKEQLRDQTGDTAFEAFRGRLFKAVAARDKAMLASMMAPDFGYRWDKGPDGETPFAYWDRYKLWGELEGVIKQRFVPHDAFMVAPPQFAVSPNYAGYRAGLTQVNGSWRFAYFVSPPPAGESQPEQTEEKPLPPLPQ